MNEPDMNEPDMNEPDMNEPKSQETLQSLVIAYQEVCKSHGSISDFRGKLLALLPIASGTGVGLLVIQGKGGLSKTDAGLLVALGIFGMMITVGLFLYEIRQVDTCKQLRNHGAWIERQFGIQCGQFSGRRDRLSIRQIYSPYSRKERETLLKDEESFGKERNPKVRPSGLSNRQFIGAEAAGYLIYHAVAAAWLVIAGLGVAKLL